jgi:murein DD-endopeptidase MepM/ murein hydrolase activator NlpD
MFDFGQVLDNPKSMAGNYLTIDHQNCEFSMLGHFKQGSIEVKEGDLVKQGQLLGQLGFSGSTGHWVHLHYELRNGIEMWSSEGVPSYFRDFNRILGTKIVAEERGLINTGDIVEALN